MERPENHPPPSTRAPGREAVEAYFESSWQLTEWLFGALARPGALFDAPDPLRHPLIFYFGHPAAFYVNKLVMAGLLDEGIVPALDTLFARGVDPENPEDLNSDLGWPSLETARTYRDAAYERVRSVIAARDFDRPIGSNDPLWALFMGVEHDRIHFETSSVLLRQAPLGDWTAPSGWRPAPDEGEPPELGFAEISAGDVHLGKPPSWPTYGWDNEYGDQAVAVAPFAASRTLVHNKEFLAFVEDDGYLRDALWSPAGLAWRDRVGADRPRFWRQVDGAWRYRRVFAEVPLPLAWPAEVNAFEAMAFCRWRGDARLPTEAEHHRMRHGAVLHDGDVHGAPYNLDLRWDSPCAVDALPPQGGIYDVYGNVWQWLADDFQPFPGFRSHPLYPDFSQPFFGDRHATLVGGSWASTGTSASRFYRLWFRRHFAQHAGFRIVATSG